MKLARAFNAVRWLLARPHAVFAVGMTSCGVLTIDVDVYKGTLGDHVDVQVQDLVVLAVGAKPILVELRDSLEEARLRGEGINLRDGLSSRFDHTGFVEPGEYRFSELDMNGDAHERRVQLYQDSLANRVNAALSLYDDQIPLALSARVSKLRRLADQYQQQYELLRPTASTRPDRWKRWSKYSRSTRFRARTKDSTLGSKLWDFLRDWPFDLGLYFVPDLHYGNDYQADSDRLGEIVELKSAYRAFLVGRPHGYRDWRDQLPLFRYRLPTGGDLPESVEGQFEALRDSEMVEHHSRLLFGSGSSKLRRSFVEEVRAIAASYLYAQKLAADMVRTAILLRKELINVRGDERREGQEFISRRERNMLVGASDAILATFYKGEAGDKAALSNLLGSDSDIPVFGAEAFDEIESSLRAIRFLTGEAGGFERGRLHEGLETQIEAYLRRAEGGSGGGGLEPASRPDTLVQTLLRFASKILFVADHQSVLSNELDEESLQYIRILQSVGNAIRVQADELIRYYDAQGMPAANELQALRAALDPAPQDVIARYLRALQNDELHRTSLEEETEALKKAADLAAATEKAKAEADKTATAAKAAKDAHEAKLKAERPWAAALVTLGAKLDSYTFEGPDEAELAELKAAVAEAKDGKAFAEKVAVKLKSLREQAGSGAADSGVNARRKRAEEALREVATRWAEIKADDADTLKAALVKTLGERDIDTIIGDLARQSAEAVEKAADAKDAYSKAKAEEKEVNTKRAKLEQEAKPLRERKAAVPVAREAVEAMVLELLADEGATANRVRAALLETVTNAVSASTEAEVKQAKDAFLKRSRELLAERREGASLAALDGELPAEVLDRRIADMRHRLITEIEESGLASAQRLREALSEANRQRADLAHLLRPSSVLRSSYPFADAQGDSKLDREVLEQVDRRSWQNINRVVLSGAGNTNYVVAKDDVGNWYVKGYSANAEPITKTATKLAAASLAPTGAASLFDAKGNFRDQVKVTSGLAPVFEKHEKRYEDATAKSRGELAAALGEGDSGVRAKILAAWKLEDDEVQAIVDDAWAAADLANALSELMKDDLKKDEVPDRILDGLGALGRFATLLESSVTAQGQKDAAAKAEAEAAAKQFEEELAKAVANARAAAGDSEEAQDAAEKKVREEATPPPPAQTAFGDAKAGDLVTSADKILGTVVGDLLRARRDANGDFEAAVLFIAPDEGEN